MLVLEINDMMLSLTDAERVRLRSPGQILCNGNGNGAANMLVGEPAMARRRLNPRAVHDRYWGWLDRSPLARPAGVARSHADLACVHLRHLLQQDGESGGENGSESGDWLVAVPGYYDDDQLALLLGIARAAGASVSGLLSAPVLAARAAGRDADCLVLDAGWHRFTLDRVEFVDGAHRLANDASPFVGRGLSGLLDRWAKQAADAFVLQTRLDPSHEASVEQQLYDRLPEWLRQLEREETPTAELESGSNRYRAELSSEQFVQEASAVYEELNGRIEHSGAEALILRHRLRGLPGLEAALTQNFGGELVWLDEHAPAAAALEHAGDLRPGDEAQVLYATRLPLDDESTAPTAAPPAEDDHVAAPAPSHVLIGAQAVPIEARPVDLPGASGPCQLQRDGDGSVRLLANESDGIQVNNAQAVNRQLLAAGDRVRIGEQEFVLLRVDGNGSS